MHCGLPRSASSNALAAAFSDADSAYSQTTRNTLQTSACASGPGLFQSHSNVRWRELQPSALSKAGHLESVDGDSSRHEDVESRGPESSFFDSPLKDSERDERLQQYFVLKYA